MMLKNGNIEQAVIEVMFNHILIRRMERRGKRKERKHSFLSFPSPLSFLSTMVLMFICVACSNSPVEEDNHKEAPDLEKILKDMVIIPAGEFLMGSPEGEGVFDEHPQHVVYLAAGIIIGKGLFKMPTLPTLPTLPTMCFPLTKGGQGGCGGRFKLP